jgi:L-alanine-DL-glutamate epimerase-like enolase superfamily enzyme
LTPTPPLTLTVRREAMRLAEPFRISGYLFEAMPAIVVTLSDGRFTGRGEAAGVYYLDDDPAHMESEIERCRAAIEAGVDRETLRALLPAGGARNAVDCALWELESHRSGTAVWRLAGATPPHSLVTTFTLPADDPADIARRLVPLADARAIKLKLTGEFDADAERIRTVRRLRPSVWLGVDANQGYGPDTLDALIAMLVDERVALLEQPIRRGEEAVLAGLTSPIPIAADESILDLAELHERHAAFDVINIKLDKCGGLTEALLMAHAARRLGKKVMVGNMAGSVLATAPSFVLGQFCDVVDLDGPYFLAEDAWAAKIYQDGRIMIPSGVWGAADAPLSATA